MGISIDDIEQWARQNNYTIVSDNWWNAAQDTINKYQQLQSDYETRLKADMVAMLTEIQLEIEELYPNPELNTYYRAVDDCSNLIQQKIDALKEVVEDGKA